MEKSEIVDILRETSVFENVPDDQLNWLAEKGSLEDFPQAEHLFISGQPADKMIIVVEGVFRVYIKRTDAYKEVGRIEKGHITGLLPFSRLKETQAWANAVVDSKVITFSKDCLRDMVRDCYDLTAALVHHMTNRVRSFTKSQQQDEKLMSLGKLSAGLMHELNNPAAAIVRSAQSLKSQLQLQPDKFKKVINSKMTEEQIDDVNEIIFAKLNGPRPTFSLTEKTQIEDDLADYLEDNGIEDGYELADSFLEMGYTVEDLENIHDILDDQFPRVIEWIEVNIATERLVLEIEESSNRISKLVTSVKSYSHMDSGHDKEPVDVIAGIRSTLDMLAHKVRKQKITVIEEYPEDNPKPSFKGYAGEINQIWTNVIDNASDALSIIDTPVITLNISEDENFVRVNIIDNGPGIPEELLDKIFDPFYTTKEIGKGTGMGLDVVSQIVQKHKGDVKVKSEVGRTSFEFCFPKEW